MAVTPTTNEDLGEPNVDTCSHMLRFITIRQNYFMYVTSSFNNSVNSAKIIYLIFSVLGITIILALTPLYTYKQCLIVFIRIPTLFVYGLFVQYGIFYMTKLHTVMPMYTVRFTILYKLDYFRNHIIVYIGCSLRSNH